METIPRSLRELLLAQAPRKKNGKIRLREVHKRHYILEEGSFLIRIMPTRDSPPEQHLSLLF
uniref:Uncharacterized protein n=1 Tax=Setaria italica TaxID=4555 RepID=K3XPE7_SETIT